MNNGDFYSQAEVYQWDAVKADFEETGKCNLQLAKDTYATLIVVMALPKNSPYTNSISKGCVLCFMQLFNLVAPNHDVRVLVFLGYYRLLELQESGLIDHWDLWFRPMPDQCMENVKRSGVKTRGSKKHPPLSLKNLSGAFLVLLVGVSLAVLAFLCEKIIPIVGRLRHCQRN